MKYLKRSLFIALVVHLFSIHSMAHVGSPGVTLEGNAGPYRVMVLVTPPEVIPGTASVEIYVLTPGSEIVNVKPIYWFAGATGTPRADRALEIEGEPGHYQANIWLMDHGTSSLELVVSGKEGKGSLIVPIMAVATAQNDMEASLGWTLAGLGLFLVILMVTIFSMSMSDSLIPENDEHNKTLGRKKWTGGAIGLVVIILMLYGGSAWWDASTEGYQKQVYIPWQATSNIVEKDSILWLNFSLDSMNLPILYLTRKISYIVPDHGKIMHMFLVKEGSLDAFAHIHPKRIDTLNFQVALPPLPKGRYFVYADISRLSGFSETIVDTVDIPAPIANLELIKSFMNSDDTYYVTDPIRDTTPLAESQSAIVICGSPGQKTILPDSSYAVWELPKEAKFIANRLYPLTFSIFEPNGEPANLEPYLGMMGHAVVTKEDASVYIHLHPVGNFSTASQQTLEARISDGKGLIDWDNFPTGAQFSDSIDTMINALESLPEVQRDSILMIGMNHDWEDPEHPDHSIVRFPYAFPSAGKYRVFIQMKRNGKILNSAFDVDVEEEEM